MAVLTGLSLSLIGAAFSWRSQRQQAAIRFESSVAVAQGDLAEGIRAYADIMTGVRGLAQASGRLNRALLHDYLSSMELERQYPGLRALTFGFYVAHAGKAQFEARLRAELGPEQGFAITPPGDRPDYFVVAYGEPTETNRSSIGFDTLTIPGQRASLAQAIDSGRLVASTPLKVRQYAGPDPSLILRLAVYRAGLPADTPEQRRKAVYGVINGVFRAQDLIHAALGPATLQKMEVRIEDIGAAHPGAEAGAAPMPLFGTTVPPRPPGLERLWSPPETQRKLTLGGRIWRTHFRARPSQTDNLAWVLPLGVAAAGFALTGLLAGLLGALNQTEQRAQAMAARITEQLQRSESRLKAIAQAVPDLLFVVDETGRFLEVYGGQDDLLATPRPLLLGSTLAERLPPEVARTCLAGLDRALATHQLQTISYQLPTPSGQAAFEARLFEMGALINGQRCAVILARDITERSRAEEKLRMAQKLESLGVLAGGIAHDFNNLLTAILGNLNLAQMQLPPAAPAAPFLLRVETAVLRAAELSHQMLAYSGRGTFTVAPLDLNQVVQDMAELLSVSIAKKATLRMGLAPGLPWILADAAQIQQVVMNLVINASEALGDSPGEIAITTGARFLDEAFLEAQLPSQGLQPGAHVTLTVTDSGCGMDPDTLNRIFDPFFTTKTTGRGLGLSAMLGILKGHKAGIRIDSAPGAGATFLVLIPALEASATPAPELTPEPVASRPLRGTVLVVDDEPSLLETVASIVESLGMQVVTAADGEEALERFREHRSRIDLVLMDINMPRMDGNQAFLALRELAPQLPVILSSGFTSEEVVAAPAGTRAAGFVQKPYRLAELQATLERAFQPRPPQP